MITTIKLIYTSPHSYPISAIANVSSLVSILNKMGSYDNALSRGMTKLDIF